MIQMCCTAAWSSLWQSCSHIKTGKFRWSHSMWNCGHFIFCCTIFQSSTLACKVQVIWGEWQCMNHIWPECRVSLILTWVQAGACVWNRVMAEGLALATCLGKLNISVLELDAFEPAELWPHQGGSVGHKLHCHTELKMHLKVTCCLRHSSLPVVRISCCVTTCNSQQKCTFHYFFQLVSRFRFQVDEICTVPKDRIIFPCGVYFQRVLPEVHMGGRRAAPDTGAPRAFQN